RRMRQRASASGRRPRTRARRSGRRASGSSTRRRMLETRRGMGFTVSQAYQPDQPVRLVSPTHGWQKNAERRAPTSGRPALRVFGGRALPPAGGEVGDGALLQVFAALVGALLADGLELVVQGPVVLSQRGGLAGEGAVPRLEDVEHGDVRRGPGQAVAAVG